MKSLLVHGCCDHSTLDTLLSLGVRRFAFDLRARSPNLVTFSRLQELLPRLSGQTVTLIFEDDKRSTVLSFLDLLKSAPVKLELEFRDALSAEFYFSLDRPFYWMLRPDAGWEEILSVPQLKGVLLPLKWRESYQHMPALWAALDGRPIEVLLHAENLAETGENFSQGAALSVDLGPERPFDQEHLKKLKLWRQLNEGPAV